MCVCVGEGGEEQGGDRLLKQYKESCVGADSEGAQ